MVGLPAVSFFVRYEARGHCVLVRGHRFTVLGHRSDVHDPFLTVTYPWSSVPGRRSWYHENTGSGTHLVPEVVHAKPLTVNRKS